MRCSRRPEAQLWPNAVAWLVLSLCVAGTVPATADDAQPRNFTLPGNADTFLQLDAGDRWARLAIHASIEGAFHRLASPACLQILSDFRDRSGRTLQQRLEASGHTAPDYLGVLRYTDGAGYLPCHRKGTLAFTSPGNRIVYFCGLFRDRFLVPDRQERDDLELAIIHEMLHTLGLGENPPAPSEITDQVRRRCGGR